MATWKTNRCVAIVSKPAFEAATFRLDTPDGWRIVDVLPDPVGAVYTLVFEGADAEWTVAEFKSLPCIGEFGLDGDSAGGVVSPMVRPLYDVLLAAFSRETEGKGQ